MSHQITKAIKF